MNDENRKERVEALNPRSPRTLDGSTGSFPHDGYRRLARRPRSAVVREMLPNETADSIERFESEMQAAIEGRNIQTFEGSMDAIEDAAEGEYDD